MVVYWEIPSDKGVRLIGPASSTGAKNCLGVSRCPIMEDLSENPDGHNRGDYDNFSFDFQGCRFPSAISDPFEAAQQKIQELALADGCPN